MRDYSKVSPRFWTGATGKFLRSRGPEIRVVAFYLFTCPSANMLGLYYLNFETLCSETSLRPDVARACLKQLSEALHEHNGSPSEASSESLESPFEGVFAAYDELTEYVFVPSMAAHQLGERLSPKDNRHKAVLKELEQHRKSPFFNAFVERYREAYELSSVSLNKPLRRVFEAPSKPGAGAGAGTEDRESAHTRAYSGIEAGSDLTRSPQDVRGSSLDEWKRSISEINVEKCSAWFIYLEEKGKRLNANQRLMQARTLAGSGNKAEQGEIVDYCIENDFRSLIPLSDIRARKNGMSRKSVGAVGKDRQEVERQHQFTQLKHRRRDIPELRDFRDPDVRETPGEYRQAQDDEINLRKASRKRAELPALLAGVTSGTRIQK